MKRIIILLAVMAMVLPSCRNNNKGEAMPITVNLRYTGVDGNARKFAEEMISSGTDDGHHRVASGKIRPAYVCRALPPR